METGDVWGRDAALARWREVRDAAVKKERRFLCEERAAILEYCANMPRVLAERLARDEVYGET